MHIKLILEYSKSLDVLYVEDDEDLGEKTAKLLENYFNSVSRAVNGEDALQKYRSSGLPYDLIIADINMPVMDGITLAARVREMNQNQAIIFVTAYNEIEYLSKAIELGISGFLIKPIQDTQLKQVLYKTCQAITDHKLAQRYEEVMISENIRLQEQDVQKSKKRKARSVREIIDHIEAEKETLTKSWITVKAVRQKLRQHDIEPELFRTDYGIKVLEYFIGVIRGSNKVGQCPVINTLLEFFKQKNLPLESIFIICVNFKNTLTAFTFEHCEFDRELFDELSLVLDKNFEGVVHHYMKLKGIGTEEQLPSQQEQESAGSQEDESSLIFDYAEYVFEHDIYELKELEVEIENMAISLTMNQHKEIDDFFQLGITIKKYGRMLNAYPVFEELGSCITKLGTSFYTHAESLYEDPQTTSNISTMLEGFINDLILWRKEVFEEKTDNPHFLNASFFSNVDTIISYIEADKSSEDEAGDGIDFF